MEAATDGGWVGVRPRSGMASQTTVSYTLTSASEPVTHDETITENSVFQEEEKLELHEGTLPAVSQQSNQQENAHVHISSAEKLGFPKAARKLLKVSQLSMPMFP